MGGSHVHRTRNTVRMLAGGGLAIAALTGSATLAAAATDYAPAPPTPTVTTPVPPVPSTPPQPQVTTTPPTAPTTTPALVPDASEPSRTTTTAPARARAVESAGDELAYTGADVLPWAAAGTVLVLGGAAMVVASKRRTGRQH